VCKKLKKRRQSFGLPALFLNKINSDRYKT
jgi:hypothetical protein